MTICKLFLPVALLALPLLGRAQHTELARDHSGNFNNGYALAPADASDWQGTPFLLPYWAPATLELEPAGRPVPATLKYDVYRQELRVRRPAGDSVLVPLARVRAFRLTDAGRERRFACYPAATLPADAGGGCAEVLAAGPHAELLKFVRKEAVKRAADNDSYAGTHTVNVLEARTFYYLRWAPDGQFTPLKLRRASLEQALAGQPAALAALRARQGNMGSEADLVSTFGALEPLLTSPGR